MSDQVLGVPTPLLPVLAALEASGAPSLLDRELSAAAGAGLLSSEEEDAVRRIDETLVRGRRRESLLRVLLETTTDLVAITDFDGMLQAIVRRTRMLLGSDMAYISLNDYEARETFIHTTDGVATDAYRSIRMELGTGVLGKIAEGSGSAQAIDYLSDPDIIHVEHIDETVHREGVRSIMGAPLLRDGVLLGALLVAERYQRKYTAEEVWLVESMSALACVALGNARLIGDMKAALRERDQFQGRLEDERERIADEQVFERALVDSAVTADPYGEFLATLRGRHGARIWILDDIGQPLRGEGEAPLPESTLEKALVRSHRSGNIEVLDAAPDADRPGTLLLAVGVAQRVLGGILVEGVLTPDIDRLLRRSSVMLSVLRLMDENTREETMKTQTELLAALLRPAESFERVSIQRAARFGLERDAPAYLHVVESDSSPALVIDVLRAHPSWGAGIVAEHSGRAVVLHADLLGEDIVQVLARRQVASTVGVEKHPCFDGPMGGTHQEAERTLHAMLALGLTGQASTSAELGPVGMLMSSASPAQVRAIVDLELAPLLDYDDAKGANLMDTLWAFFSCDRHQVRTANALHVHPNTLRQRLERIATLLGDDWQSARRSSMVFLALQLHRLGAVLTRE